MFHENGLLADDSHEISYFIFFLKLGKMSQNLSSAAVVIGTLRVNMCSVLKLVSLAISPYTTSQTPFSHTPFRREISLHKHNNVELHHNKIKVMPGALSQDFAQPSPVICQSYSLAFRGYMVNVLKFRTLLFRFFTLNAQIATKSSAFLVC